MRDLKRILELRFENHSQREIARMLKVSRNTVRDVFDAADAAGVYWNTAYNLSESQINELLFPSNGIDVSYEQPDYAYVHKELLKVGVSLKMLWKEYVDQCKSTHKVYLKYSAFCNNYSSYVKKNKLTMHITHKPGDRIMVDWDGKTMKVHDRSLNQDVTAYMFVAVLPFSMYCYVEACPRMDSKNWINCHIHAFEYFGGVSRILVPDNLKTGVTEHKKYEDPVLNKSYQEMADYYGMAVIPARVKMPKDKGAAEGSVFSMATTIIGILRNRTFFTFESLNKAIYIEMNKLNDEKFQKREGSRKSVYMDEEKDFMNPLPEHPFELSEWKMATVQLNYHIQVEKMNYSIPYEYVGKRVEVKLTKDTVTVFNKNRMTIEECYVKMGANYQDVIKRLPSAKMIEKFALKFKDDTSFQEIETALNEKQVELAFRAAHTLKGVCMNLGFDHLYKPSFEITESLRAGNLELGLQQFGAVKEQYTKTIDALNEFVLENE